jgi:phosphate:Na+ symporter
MTEMDFFDLLSLLGGLALFLYGMDILGTCLSKMAGGKMQQVLGRLTSNPYMGILLGAGVTAVIQSSSATTVMTVGFVNSGIMELEQAVGIIMGANIGTTATSWILSLTGISGGSFFVRLLKPMSFTPILGIIGIGLLLFSRRDRNHNIGGALLGFMMLMFGMDRMSSAVAGLKDVPQFTRVLTAFANPVLGVLVGAAVTAVIQSSSASIGILQALCRTGQVTFGAAVPIILGQNIGTCVTAMLSAIGASKNAKRTAFLHFYFNLIGTVVFMLLFYLTNALLDFPFMQTAAGEAGIAAVHTVFNVAATLLWLPFSKQLVKLATISVKEDLPEEEKSPYEKELQVLDPRFLNNPSYAVSTSFEVTGRMADLSREALFHAMELLTDYSEERFRSVLDLEAAVDQFEDRLGTYMVRISEQEIQNLDGRMLTMLMHSVGDLERLSDHAVNIAYVARKIHEKDLKISNKTKEELLVLERAIYKIVNTAIQSFHDQDLTLANTVEPLEEVIHRRIAQLKKRHVKRLQKGKCTVDLGMELTDITSNLERVSDHCSNLAVCLIQIHENSFDTHEYLETVRRESPEFKSMYDAYLQEYQLP